MLKGVSQCMGSTGVSENGIRVTYLNGKLFLRLLREQFGIKNEGYKLKQYRLQAVGLHTCMFFLLRNAKEGTDYKQLKHSFPT